MNHLPTHEEQRQLFAELKQLDAEPSHEFNERKYEIIDALAEAHFYEAIPYFNAGLENPDPGYRRACIRALVTHWRYGDSHTQAKLRAMAADDPEEQVRQMAIDSLGILKVRDAVPILMHLVEQENESADLKRAAYLSILRIYGFPPENFTRYGRVLIQI